MTSGKAQEITLVLPRAISEIKADGKTVAGAAAATGLKLTLPAGKRVTLSILME
jgi:hypothetical protein